MDKNVLKLTHIKADVRHKIKYINLKNAIPFLRLYLDNKSYRKYIINGRSEGELNIRPREFLGLFLVAAVGSFIADSEWTISTSPLDDGGVFCTEEGRKGEGFLTEQTYVPYINIESNPTEDILEKIKNKIKEGSSYAENSPLVVLCDQPGMLNYYQIREGIPNENNFLSIWIISRKTIDNLSWNVAIIKAVRDKERVYQVTIDKDNPTCGVTLLGKVK